MNIAWQMDFKQIKKGCIIFNKGGRLGQMFHVGSEKLETVRSYKYFGLVFTSSGGIKSALEDLRSGALKAYMSFKNKIGQLLHYFYERNCK